jgi:hypothetical protein
MTETNSTIATKKPRSKAQLYWVLGICIAPTIAAFATFYLVDWAPNTDTTNYGELLTGQNAIASLSSAKTLDGKQFEFKTLQKKWIYASVDSGACDEPCAKRLFTSRQLRAISGRERDRVARLWLVTDDAPIKPELLAAHPDLTVVRVSANDAASLPVKTGQSLNQHTWIIDPLGRPMMRYEAVPDHNRMKKDLSKLLYASKSWQN